MLSLPPEEGSGTKIKVLSLHLDHRMYSIEYAEGVVDDLALLRTRDRKHVLDQLEKQLKYEPTKKTKNRKPLPRLIPPWEHVEPVWELRVGEYRIFYDDVDDQVLLVTIRAIRHKPPHKTTEEIL